MKLRIRYGLPPSLCSSWLMFNGRVVPSGLLLKHASDVCLRKAIEWSCFHKAALGCFEPKPLPLSSINELQLSTLELLWSLLLLPYDSPVPPAPLEIPLIIMPEDLGRPPPNTFGPTPPILAWNAPGGEYIENLFLWCFPLPPPMVELEVIELSLPG